MVEFHQNSYPAVFETLSQFLIHPRDEERDLFCNLWGLKMATLRSSLPQTGMLATLWLEMDMLRLCALEVRCSIFARPKCSARLSCPSFYVATLGDWKKKWCATKKLLRDDLERPRMIWYDFAWRVFFYSIARFRILISSFNIEEAFPQIFATRKRHFEYCIRCKSTSSDSSCYFQRPISVSARPMLLWLSTTIIVILRYPFFYITLFHFLI